MNKKLVIGFAGTGVLGSEMIKRLLQHGYAVQVWNRTAEKAQALVAAGAQVAATPQQLAQKSDLLLLCLTDQQAVQEVVFGPEGISSAQRAIDLVDHSSIAPEATQDFAQRYHQATTAQWLDAPISGGVKGAQEGVLAIMVGGDSAATERVRPVLDCYAARVTHLGSSGAGQVAKLCNQTIVATTINAIAEAVSLAAKAGITAPALQQALAGGWADSVLLQTFVPRMTQGYDKQIGSVATMHKDVANVLAYAQSLGLDLPLVQATEQNWAHVIKMGLAEQDLSHIVDATLGNEQKAKS